MDGNMEDTSPPAASLLPPATTRWQPVRPAAVPHEPRIAPPFVMRSTAEPRVEAPVNKTVNQPIEEPLEEPAPVEPPSASDDVESAMIAADFLEAEPEEEPEPQSWEPEEEPWEPDTEDEGVVRPAFEADTDAALEALTQQVAELTKRDDFPLEAFIVPEQAKRIPNGVEGKPTAQPEITPLSSLSDRLEKLSHRLRVEETDAIIRRLAGGDRIDTMLAGLLAGYLAGTSEQP
jgi:hypothetical protein